MIMFKIIKDAYVLKRIDGNPAPAQQLKIALSRSALPALTTGTPGPVGHTLSALSIGITTSGPQRTQRSASVEICILLAGKKKITKRRKNIFKYPMLLGEREINQGGEKIHWGSTPTRAADVQRALR